MENGGERRIAISVTVAPPGPDDEDVGHHQRNIVMYTGR